jgi:thiosulfate dehydrogenase
MSNEHNNNSMEAMKSNFHIVLLTIASILVTGTVVYNLGLFDPKPYQYVGEDNLKLNAGADAFWEAPEISEITDPSLKEQVEYGKELIAHTAKYLGPKGLVLRISNGMNCQNCHLDAGTKVWGNNYGSVASTYPKMRARSGKVEDIYKRVNDCFERSLNGKALDTSGKEMQAIKAYIEFLGAGVAKGEKAKGSGFKEMPYLDRAADPIKGKLVYEAKCQSCHQPNGEGVKMIDGSEYTYPPLWGNNCYNDGAGLYRISNFARYVKNNMPFGVNHKTTQLSDEEAWDIAAFANSQVRPHLNVPKDWPDISKKPIDHPFGPYSDSFSEKQHKYGPFKPIEEYRKQQAQNTKPKKTS